MISRLLGYLQIKNNPWPYVNLANLVHNSRIGDGEVVELLKIANGLLPRVKLEYDIVSYELDLLKADTKHTVETHQLFVDQPS